MDGSAMVITVRGWTTSGEPLLFGRPGGEIRDDFINALKNELGGAEIWAPELDLSMFSMRTAESLSEELFAKIDRKLADSPHIEHIVLLGYSSGTLLARRVFCMAHGADNTGHISAAVPWAHKIDRLVMLSGITRGWEYSSAAPAFIRFFSPVLLNAAKLVGWWKAGRKEAPGRSRIPFIWQLRRGSPFVVTTRLQYIDVMETLRNTAQSDGPLRINGLPSTIFLLGAQDEFVSPADCTEMGPRTEFAFVELGKSNHSQALQISGANPEAMQRRARLTAAVRDEFSDLVQHPWAVPADDIDDYADPMDLADTSGTQPPPPAAVAHAVIIVHGIRDNGFWTKRVAREIKSLGREHQIVVRAPTPTYGYFSMWDFIKPGGREQATYWFLERYADVRTHFPAAKISFVGHSNGTYIAARAIELCPAIRFENLVFAGSVVRCDFPWDTFAAQVRAVLNYVGSADGVVACLPGVIERLRLRWFNVGGAGAFGFHFSGQQVSLKEYRYVAGSHDAAITETFWPEIARFALLGEYPAQRQRVGRKPIVELMFHHAPPFVLVIATLGLLLLASPWLVGGALIIWLANDNITSFPQVSLVGWILIFSSSFAVSWALSRFIRKW